MYSVFFFFVFLFCCNFIKAYDVEVKEKLAQWSLDYMNGVIVRIAGASIIFKPTNHMHIQAVRVPAFFFLSATIASSKHENSGYD